MGGILWLHSGHNFWEYKSRCSKVHNYRIVFPFSLSCDNLKRQAGKAAEQGLGTTKDKVLDRESGKESGRELGRELGTVMQTAMEL